MKRRTFITLLGGIAALPFAARAQHGLRRIGVLMSFAAHDPEGQQRIVAFEQGMRDLGWVEGRNLRVTYRWALGDAELRNAASELSRTASSRLARFTR